MDIILWHSILIISVPLSLGLQARWQQICNLKFAVIGNLCITLREQAVGLHDILEKIRSVMLILQLENLRNFLPSKDGIVVLTHIAWAFPTSSQPIFLVFNTEYEKMDRVDMLRAERHYRENCNAMFKAATGYELGGGVDAPVTEESRKYDYLETDYHK